MNMLFIIEKGLSMEIVRYLSDILFNINEGVIILNKDSSLEYINKAGEKMLKINFSKVIGMKIDEIIPESYLAKKFKELEQVNNLEEGNYTFTSKLIKDKDDVIGSIIILNDIGEYKELNNKIKKYEFDIDILNTIFNSTDECFVVVDENGIITMMSKAYRDFMNCTNPEGKHVTEVVENTRLHIVGKTGEKEVGEIQEAQGHKMISMRVPIEKDGKIVGAIGKIMFKDLDTFKILSNKITNLEKEVEYYKNELSSDTKAKFTFNNLIGSSDKMVQVVNLAKRVARNDSNVLITGESGTGKELLAHAIHNASKRCLKPFIKINCAAIPEELFESEMFGYEEGAFTGARKTGKMGKFEYANGGTILLDEIGDMPMSMQVKLLRVIQEKELVRVGGNDVRKVDVRIIASTNKSLKQLVDAGKFRHDLYYRLNVMHLELPPLRERSDDIEVLANKLRVNICQRYGLYSEGISSEACKQLKNYDWPGNVRELENVIERAINLLDTELIILPKHLPEKIIRGSNRKYSKQSNCLKDVVESVEKEIIIECLKETKGNKNEAALRLGLSRAGLYKKLKRYDLEKFNVSTKVHM